MDSEFQRQLEQFGTESIQIVKGDLNKKRQDERHQAHMAVVKALMERIEGRQWLYDVLDMCMTNGVVFVPGKPDLTTFFQGAQWIGQAVLRQIMEAAPNEYFVMIQEENTRNLAKKKNQDG